MSADLIKAVAEETGESRATVKRVLDSILDEISKSLKEKEDVTLYGFGKFSTVERGARKGRNPSTGKAIDIAASTGAKFKPALKLKTFVNS